MWAWGAAPVVALADTVATTVYEGDEIAYAWLGMQAANLGQRLGAIGQSISNFFQTEPTPSGGVPGVPPIRPDGPGIGPLLSGEPPSLGLLPSDLPDGSFSISDWSGYPDGILKPEGPFRLIEGEEYAAARNAANYAIRNADPSLAGKQIHEIQPIKFVGSPTDPSNKMALTPADHSTIATWWNRLMRSLNNQ